MSVVRHYELLLTSGVLTRVDPIAITRCGLVENQQLVIARGYRERVFIFNVCNNWRICSVWQVVNRTLVRF